MKINIIPKKEITPSNNPIEFKDGFYLHSNEFMPAFEEKIIQERIIPSNKEALIKPIEKDDILEEKELDVNFRGLDDYSKVLALHKEKSTRGK